MIELSADEHDALLEVFNIAVGSSAQTLSQMVNDEITLKVPSFEFVNIEDLEQRAPNSANKQVCAVTEHTSGSFEADAILMFEEDNAIQVVQSMMQEEGFSEQIPLEEFSEIQQEAMTEIGNVVLNACMGSIANLFQSKFKLSAPRYNISSYDELFNSYDSGDNLVLLLLIDFGLRRQDIEGHLAFLMDLPAMEELKKNVQTLLESYGS